MKLDEDIFIELVKTHAEDKGVLGPCVKSTARWCEKNRLPDEIRHLFKTNMPKANISAGAGTLFDELNLIRWNEDFPEALHARLLIIGSAANGDHIVINMKDGSTGYISHENDWQQSPRNYFVAVSPSIGSYLRDINHNPPLVPEDFWMAKSS